LVARGTFHRRIDEGSEPHGVAVGNAHLDRHGKRRGCQFGKLRFAFEAREVLFRCYKLGAG